jgi:hypothetical protein
MPESPEDRTKRVFIKALINVKPCYQVSLAFNPEDYQSYEAGELIKNLPRFKKRLGDLFDYPILSWVQLKKKNNQSIPMLVMFFAECPSKNELRKIEESVDRIFSECFSLNVLYRKFSLDRLLSRIKALKSGKLHDISKVFGGAKINRFTIINKSKFKEYNATILPL